MRAKQDKDGLRIMLRKEEWLDIAERNGWMKEYFIKGLFTYEDWENGFGDISDKRTFLIPASLKDNKQDSGA